MERPLDMTNQLLVSANFAEGQDPFKIDAVVRQLAASRGISLIEVDPNRHFNTTTVIYGGPPEALLEATFSLTEAVLEHLDRVAAEKMQPGVLQPVAFIPLRDAEMPLARATAERFCRDVADRYRIPVFHFGLPALGEERYYPADFREILEPPADSDAANGMVSPDLGPERINPHVGIMISGARHFHLNLAVYFETDKIEMVERWLDYAKDTQAGGSEEANLLRSRLALEANIFAEELQEERRVRLLCNIPDYTRLMLTDLFTGMDTLSLDLGIELIGAELLGFTPGEPMIEAGKFHFSKLYDEKIDNDLRCMMITVQRLKLNEISAFDLRRQVLEYRLCSGG